MAITEPLAAAHDAFRDKLLGHGLLLATGVPGVYGRSAEFEDTVARVDALVIAAGAGDEAEFMRFPPVLNRSHFERSGYHLSFPHLAGTIHGFRGTETAYRELVRAVEEDSDWTAAFTATPLVLTPAACYPVYPALAGTLPPAGRVVDVMSYCFRHEPSCDAARMQIFRMHEHVRAGAPDVVLAWRDIWLKRVDTFTAALDLDTRVMPASDPFFGRGGKLLAANQRDQGLKLEVVAPISSSECPTAIISLNYHQDHFGQLFGIRTADGSVAHTSCVGFGLERTALALYARHGFDRGKWPTAALRTLDL